MRAGAGASRGRTGYGFPNGNRKNPAREDTAQRTPAKMRFQVVFSEQDDKRVRIHLCRPRAAAHRWGKGAHILTEINRLPHSARCFQGKDATHATSCRLVSRQVQRMSPVRCSARSNKLDAGIWDWTQVFEGFEAVRTARQRSSSVLSLKPASKTSCYPEQLDSLQ